MLTGYEKTELCQVNLKKNEIDEIERIKRAKLVGKNAYVLSTVFCFRICSELEQNGGRLSKLF